MGTTTSAHCSQTPHATRHLPAEEAPTLSPAHMNISRSGKVRSIKQALPQGSSSG